MKDINIALAQLVHYALEKELIFDADCTWAVNQLLEVLRLDRFDDPGEVEEAELEDILANILELSLIHI